MENVISVKVANKVLYICKKKRKTTGNRIFILNEGIRRVFYIFLFCFFPTGSTSQIHYIFDHYSPPPWPWRPAWSRLPSALVWMTVIVSNWCPRCPFSLLSIQQLGWSFQHVCEVTSLVCSKPSVAFHHTYNEIQRPKVIIQSLPHFCLNFTSSRRPFMVTQLWITYLCLLYHLIFI